MSMGDSFEIGTKSHLLKMTVQKGHFATSHSHTNYYFDVTRQKNCLQNAKAVAQALSGAYYANTIVDTVLCLDGTEVIGTLLARELTKNDFFGVNAGNDINILTPEHTTGSQLFFRDNTSPMVTGKNVLLLAVSVVTGYTVKAAAEAISYYGGNVVGVASIFATMDECVGIPVNSVFDPKDLPDYATFSSFECPMCKRGERIDALVNNFGISKL